MATLTHTETEAALAELTGWAHEAGCLHKVFRFRDFPRAFGFMAAVATVAEAMNHHPDWSNTYSKVDVRLSTHDEGGITAKDVALARRMDELARALGD
jgi:4a-hydroxytetrahydrobiopterin dehydratase